MRFGLPPARGDDGDGRQIGLRRLAACGIDRVVVDSCCLRCR